jgi:hypothetical protein
MILAVLNNTIIKRLKTSDCVVLIVFKYLISVFFCKI